MKLFFQTLFFSSLVLASCDPIIQNPFDEKKVQFQVEILNPKDTFLIGDTLRILMEIPDTVIMNGSVELLNSKESGGLNYSFYRVDTIENNFAGYIPASEDHYLNFVTHGKLYYNRSISLEKEGGRLYSNFFLIPLKKGVYFIESQGGSFVANNNTLNSKVVYDYQVSNNNIAILRAALGSKITNLETFLQNCEKDKKGLFVFVVR